MQPRGETKCTTNPCKTPVLVLDWKPQYPAVQVSKWENGGEKFTMAVMTPASTTWLGPPCIGFINYTPPAGVEKCSWLAGKTQADWNENKRSTGGYYHDWDGNNPVMFSAAFKGQTCEQRAQWWKNQFQSKCMNPLKMRAGVSMGPFPDAPTKSFEITACPTECTACTSADNCQACATGYFLDGGACESRAGRSVEDDYELTHREPVKRSASDRASRLSHLLDMLENDHDEWRRLSEEASVDSKLSDELDHVQRLRDGLAQY